MKTWLITGCSSGLGKSLAQAVLEHGDQVVVTARNPETVQFFKESFPDTALPVQLDVTRDDEAANCIAGAIERFGRIDVLVNNAGYCLRGAVEECSFEEIRRQFETNFFGTVRMIQHVLPHMRQQKSGVIINFSSIAALATAEGSAFYGASKCAVEGLSDGLRKEAGPLGIKVIVVEPGPFRTDFFGRSIAVNENNIEDYKNTAGKRKVRLANPEDSGMKGWGDNGRAALSVRLNVPLKLRLARRGKRRQKIWLTAGRARSVSCWDRVPSALLKRFMPPGLRKRQGGRSSALRQMPDRIFRCRTARQTKN